jgi:CRP/FNR family nitrogen fixation transcriptional regulator
MTQLAFSVDPAASMPWHMPAGDPWTRAPAKAGHRQGVALQAIGPVLQFAQDRDIYGEGDEADVFFKVVSGVVRTCKFLSDGRRQIDSFHVAGDVFGLETGHAHSLCAEAVSDCAVISYRRRGLETLAANDQALSHQLFSYAMRNLARAQEHSLLLGRRNAVEKVAAFLIDMSERAPPSEVILLAMTRQDIADYLGLTMETVSRTFSQLEREAFIELASARQVRMKNLAALRRLNS